MQSLDVATAPLPARRDHAGGGQDDDPDRDHNSNQHYGHAHPIILPCRAELLTAMWSYQIESMNLRSFPSVSVPACCAIPTSYECVDRSAPRRFLQRLHG